MLVLEYQKENDRKIHLSNMKLIAFNSDIDKAVEYMHLSIITKIKIMLAKIGLPFPTIV